MGDSRALLSVIVGILIIGSLSFVGQNSAHAGTNGDVTPPVIMCPGDITIKQTDPIDPGFTGEATATDESELLPITFVDVVTDGNPVIITRTWTATDIFGNSSSCVQTITIGPLEVEIDIKPGSDPNSININSRGLIPVAIIGSAVCEVSEIYTDSISFEGASPIKEAFEDVDDDGITDLLLFFRTQDTGIGCGDTEATLRGMLTDNEFFIGTDSIKVVPCIDG